MMTVMVADMAMQKARVWSSSVISEPTVRISLGPNRASPRQMPMAPTIITQSGIWADLLTAPLPSTSAMPASGPTALATSLAPWAKLKSAAANISGMVNITLTRALSFGAALFDCRATRGRTTT